MWKQLFKALKYIITFAEKLQKLEARAKEQSEQIRRLADNQARMYYEFQLQRERDARERERAENEALRQEKPTTPRTVNPFESAATTSGLETSSRKNGMI